MSYQVALGRVARNDLQRLDKIWQQRVAKRLQALTDAPRPSGVVKLRGAENEWRVRVGDYRIIYEINDDERLVTILRIRHRRQAYR